MREAGWTARVVERWNPWAKKRQDLFGGDILCLGFGSIMLVQTTSGTNFSDRLTKVITSEDVKKWLECRGGFEVHGWRKVGPRGKRKTWQCRIAWIGISVNGDPRVSALREAT